MEERIQHDMPRGRQGGRRVEAQLDHVVGSKISATYDRSHRIELRRGLMEWYEETLIAVRDGATVVAMRATK